MQALGGVFGSGTLLSWFLATEAGRVSATVWLSHWTGAADAKGGAPHPAMWYLMIYTAISAGQVSL